MTSAPFESEFSEARSALAEARDAAGELLRGWGLVSIDELVSIDVHTDPTGAGRIDLYCHWPAELSETLEEAASRFARELKRSMDEAVLATATIVCSSLGAVDRSSHIMPLCDRPEEFDTLVSSGGFKGLRPDQVRILRSLQPFINGSQAASFVGQYMGLLASLLSADESGRRRLTVWAGGARPEVSLSDGTVVADVRVVEDGPLNPTRTIATYQVEPTWWRRIQANPGVELSLVFNAPPWPTDSDDSVIDPIRALCIISEHFIDGLHNSVSQPDLLHRTSSLDELAPAVAEEPWQLIDFENSEQQQEACEAIEASDLGLASHRDDNGNLTLLTLMGENIVGRVVPEASVVVPVGEESLGIATENATLAVAARWGLPDFVYRPHAVAKGNATRELGDGTLVTGSKGISLQVKARENPTDNPERERKWLSKKARDAGRQAAGTVRTALNQSTVELVNLRDRAVRLVGSAVTWAGVVILDHPTPPPEVTVFVEQKLPTLVILRRDWEWLWDQLRSASAIVDYVHRVTDTQPVELGAESVRYFDLAHTDANTPPGPPVSLPENWNGTNFNTPQLPREPVASSDAAGHDVFRAMLDDIANVEFDGDENLRLEILAKIDRLSVGHRADLGRLLLRWLDQCSLTPANETRWNHRTILIENGSLHLAFSVCSTLTGYHRELYRDWLMLRRHDLLAQSQSTNDELPWTIGVLLTPRPDGERFWDTTMFATQEDSELDPYDLENLSRNWSRDPSIDVS